MKKNMVFLAILSVVFLMPFTAMADSYTLDDILFSKTGTAKIKLNGTTSKDVLTGSFTITIEGINDSFTAFCIDPDQVIYTGKDKNLPVEMVPVSTVAGGEEAAWLLQEYGNDMDTSAMQIALWEVVKDTGNYDLESGNFILTSASDDTVVRDFANSYLENLTENFSADGLDAYFMASTNPKQQDLVYIGTVLGSSETPEPATMALLGFGIFGLAALRKNVRKS